MSSLKTQNSTLNSKVAALENEVKDKTDKINAQNEEIKELQSELNYMQVTNYENNKVSATEQQGFTGDLLNTMGAAIGDEVSNHMYSGQHDTQTIDYHANDYK